MSLLILFLSTHSYLQRLICQSKENKSWICALKFDNNVCLSAVLMVNCHRTLHPNFQRYCTKPRKSSPIHSFSLVFINKWNYLPLDFVLWYITLLDEHVRWAHQIRRSLILWWLVECKRFRRVLQKMEHSSAWIPLLLCLLRCHQIL